MNCSFCGSDSAGGIAWHEIVKRQVGMKITPKTTLQELVHVMETGPDTVLKCACVACIPKHGPEIK